MGNGGDCRLELVPARLIRRMPGLRGVACPKAVGKARDLARERGHCRPVVLSDSDGCMALLAGAPAFEACLEEKGERIPAVIVRTGGEADDLLFALQSAGLDEAPNAAAVGAAIVRLVDTHGVPRRRIAQALGKSPAWLCRTESLGRKLNAEVQGMVAEGLLPARTAQEIARLPDEAQAPFAVSASGGLLCKDDVAYLVGRYLDEDTGAEERERIIRTPWMALPGAPRRRGRARRDDSDGARLSRAIARCLDDACRLSHLLDRFGEADMRMPDAIALADSLAALHLRMRAAIYPGQSDGCPGAPYAKGGNGNDRKDTQG